MTRVGSAGSTVPTDRVTLGLACLLRNVDDVLRCIATCSLSRKLVCYLFLYVLCRDLFLYVTATRKLVQRDDLSSSTLGIGHLVGNV